MRSSSLALLFVLAIRPGARAQSTPDVPSGDFAVFSVVYGLERTSPLDDMLDQSRRRSRTVAYHMRCALQTRGRELRCELWTAEIFERTDGSCLISSPRSGEQGAVTTYTWNGSAWVTSEIMAFGQWLQVRMLVPSADGWRYRESWQPVEGVCDDRMFTCDAILLWFEPMRVRSETINTVGFEWINVPMPACAVWTVVWSPPPARPDQRRGRAR